MSDESEQNNELDQKWTDLGAFIREQRETMHFSLRKLSELADVSNPYLSQIERGLRHPSAEILQQIGRALEISSETLYVRAGILEQDTVEVDVEGEIRRDPALSEENKRILCSTYRALRETPEVEEAPLTRAADSAVEQLDETPAVAKKGAPKKAAPKKPAAKKTAAAKKKTSAKKAGSKTSGRKKSDGVE